MYSLKVYLIDICLYGPVVKTLFWNAWSREFEPQFGIVFFFINFIACIDV